MNKKKNYNYMHTIKGKPAYFDGNQIVYCAQYGGHLCYSLKEIREEQKKSNELRTKMGFPIDTGDDYIKVVI